MRILVFHGYLLHGTGSNVYNARLVVALARQGRRFSGALGSADSEGASGRTAATTCISSPDSRST